MTSKTPDFLKLLKEILFSKKSWTIIAFSEMQRFIGLEHYFLEKAPLKRRSERAQILDIAINLRPIENSLLPMSNPCDL
ncbi:8874_t:CDS:2 [Cetraspora pellucida]|uniref:8874_t:CDS:1 n=1 Tax=Cetraspora pellucida TaxID=1433469 RepID=A0A9N9A5V6_9GLOM|nr:8874_t:CDS:2 [Cetraspora pellucida]